MNIKKVRELAEDMAKRGLRFDMNPTHNFSTRETIEDFFHKYIKRMDNYAKEQAKHILKLLKQ